MTVIPLEIEHPNDGGNMRRVESAPAGRLRFLTAGSIQSGSGSNMSFCEVYAASEATLAPSDCGILLPRRRVRTGSSMANVSSCRLDSLDDSPDEPESGVHAGIFNLANTIMGASLTGIPYVMRCSGVVPFLSFMTMSVLVGYTTLQMLITASASVTGTKDYQAVGRLALGPKGLYVTALGTVLSCYGALTAYFVLIGTTAPIITEFLPFSATPIQIQLFFAVFIVWPLCTLKDIAALAPASFVAILVFALVALTSVGAFVTNDSFYTSEKGIALGVSQDHDGIQLFPKQFGLKELAQLPTLVMAFNCQYAVLPILGDLLTSGRQRDMNTVCAGGLGCAYTVYVVLALCAYGVYQGHTKDMILLNFRHCHGVFCADENPFISILNILFLIAVVMGYPVVHFACRRAQIAMTCGVDSDFSWAMHLGIATFNVVMTLSVALIVGSQVSLVFRWTGAVASPLLSFILPSLFYVRILGDNGVPLFSQRRLKGVAVILYGFTIMCVGLACNVLVP